MSNSIRFFRQINAPMLDKEPRFDGSSPLIMDVKSKRLENQSTSSWVQLGTILDAYHIGYTTGDRLEISKDGAALPVHPYWIFAIGLAGRYSRRKADNVLLPIKKKRAPTPGATSFYRGLGNIRLNDFSAPDYHWRRGLICGTTGIIEGYGDRWTFRPHTMDRIGNIAPDTLSLKALLWLSLGVIPFENSVYSLAEVEGKPVASDLIHPVAKDDDDLFKPHRTTNRMARLHDDLSESSGLDITQAQGTLRGCGFAVLQDKDDALVEVFRPFGGFQETVFGLEEIQVRSKESPELASFYTSTFIPASSSWVRISKEEDIYPENATTWVMRRSDAQKLALALLSVDWSPEGYLFGVQRESTIWNFLCRAAKEVYRLLDRTQDGMKTFDLDEAGDRVLTKKLSEALHTNTKHSFERQEIKAFFNLEQELFVILEPHRSVSNVIGVLTITNEEFLSLVVQSARHLGAEISTGITLDTRKRVLKVPSTFGVLQEFPLDLSTLVSTPNPRKHSHENNIPVSLQTVVLASLASCVRSALLEVTWPAEPLMTWVSEYANAESSDPALFL